MAQCKAPVNIRDKKGQLTGESRACRQDAKPGSDACYSHRGWPYEESDMTAGKKKGQIPARPCSATARSTGERCNRDAIRGGTVCYVHGGTLPVVKAAAAREVARQEGEALLSRMRAKNEVVVAAGGGRTIEPVNDLDTVTKQLTLLADALGERLGSDPLSDPVLLEQWRSVQRDLVAALGIVGRLTVPQRIELNGRMLLGDGNVVIDRIIEALLPYPEAQSAVIAAMQQAVPAPPKPGRTVRGEVA